MVCCSMETVMTWQANSTRLPHLSSLPASEIAYVFRLNDNPYLFGVCVTLDLATIVLQSITCYVFWCSTPGLSHPTTRILFNQSFAELCVALGHIINIFAPSPINLPPTTASKILCRLWLSRYLIWSLYSVALNSLILSSLDRYLATLHPIKHRTSFGTTQVTTGILIVWVNGFASSSLIITYTSLNPEFGFCTTSFGGALGTIFGVIYSMWAVSIPAVLLVFFFFSIFWRLRKTSLEKGVVHGEVFRRAKINTLVTMVIVCTTYHLTFIPVYVICFFKVFESLPKADHTTEIAMKVSLVAPIICVFCNPWIFYFKNPKFRYAFKKTYLSFRKRFMNEVDVANNGR